MILNIVLSRSHIKKIQMLINQKQDSNTQKFLVQETLMVWLHKNMKNNNHKNNQNNGNKGTTGTNDAYQKMLDNRNNQLNQNNKEYKGAKNGK